MYLGDFSHRTDTKSIDVVIGALASRVASYQASETVQAVMIRYRLGDITEEVASACMVRLDQLFPGCVTDSVLTELGHVPEEVRV